MLGTLRFAQPTQQSSAQLRQLANQVIYSARKQAAYQHTNY